MTAPLPLNLLVIDDDDVDRERVLRLLVGSPYAVHAEQAASGAEALAMVRAKHFDCVVLDQNLGDTTGAELLALLRLEANADCPVIMVTGAGSEALAVHAMREGAADYLIKPQLSAQGLVRSIERSLERQHLKRELNQLHQQLERRVDEQAATIRQRERDLRSILDNAPAMMGYWDADLRIRFGNRAYQDWFGIRADQIPGLPLQQVMDSRRLEDSWPHIQAALQGEPRHFERETSGEGGQPSRHTQVDYRPDVNEQGQVQGFYVTVIDVTPIKAAQARAEELLRFSEAVIHNAPVGITVYQADGHCVITNAAAARILGLSLDTLRGRNFRHSTEWQQTGLLQQAEDTLADGLPRQLELRWPLADGRITHHAVSLARVDRGGQPHLLVMARDTTEQRMTHDALVAARNAAEDAARTKSAFLANMSHEIRTPMNAIIGLSRLALDATLPEPAATYLDKVHGAAMALMGILDDVLDYSKIEAGQLRFEQLPMDLPELLQRVQGLFIARIEQKGLGFTIEPAPDLPQHLSGDALRLSQVLNNLVGNAVKFTDSGHIRVAVALAEPVVHGAADCLLRFTVQDTGIGIAADQHAALFEAFAQGDNSITRRFGGSGLGLTICKRLVEMMGGRIGLDSQPGAGSRFWFTVRLGLLPGAPAQPARVAGVAAAHPVTHRPPLAELPNLAALPPGLRLLVVEDNEMNQLVARQFLQRMGVAVTVVGDGAQAVAAVQAAGAGHFAAVLMDLHMPVMDGLEATRRIHALPGQGALPVIGMTAAAMPEDRARCFAAGMVSHVAKPVMPERLLQVLQQCLGMARPPTVPVPVLPTVPPHASQPASQPVAPEPRTGGSAIDAEGFDLPALRRRLAGNEVLVWRLLDMFVQRDSHTPAALRELIEQGQMDAARLRAHDLKGSAATLGATGVAAASAALEAALRHGGPTEAALAALHQAMDAAIAALPALRARKP